MLGRSIQLLSNETLQSAVSTSFGIAGNIVGSSVGGVFTSQSFTLDGFNSWVLVVHLGGTPTGTTPTLLWKVQTSVANVSWADVGAALTAMTPAILDQITAYVTGSTQGAITGPFFRVVATPGGTTPVFPNVYADIIAQQF
jgi:hypothetical protein